VANSSVLGWVGSGQTVRAWCLTGFNPVASVLHNNHVNGYNLTLDDVKYLSVTAPYGSQQGLSTAAIPFRFVSPMPDARYKIFVQPRLVNYGTLYPYKGLFTHALNTPQYPKTVNGFWVRFGLMIDSTNDIGYCGDGVTTGILYRPKYGEILNRSSASGTYQLQVVVI